MIDTVYLAARDTWRNSRPCLPILFPTPEFLLYLGAVPHSCATCPRTH